MRRVVPLAFAVLCGATPAPPPSRSSSAPRAGGAVTYQETPCPVTRAEQKRVDTSHGGSDPAARALLEREAYRGDPLARGFVDDARERERRAYLERAGARGARPPRAPEGAQARGRAAGLGHAVGLARPARARPSEDEARELTRAG